MTARGRALLWGAAALGAAALGLQRQRASARSEASVAAALSAAARAGEAVLRVPHAPGSITLDGDTDDLGWSGTPTPARTGDFFMPSGARAIPFSEVRAVWGDGYLYLCLYASDEDIESRADAPGDPQSRQDSFRLVFRAREVDYAIEVSPRAVVTGSIRRGRGAWDPGWTSGAHASREWDGTLDDPRDTDEEWVIEMAVPFESLGLRGERGETIGFTASRCDTPKHGPRVCTSWGEGDRPGRIVLD